MSPGAEVKKVQIIRDANHRQDNQADEEKRAADSGLDHKSQLRLFVLKTRVHNDFKNIGWKFSLKM